MIPQIIGTDRRRSRQMGTYTFIGIDFGKPGGDMTACLCPQCRTLHTWEARTEPQKCPKCGFLFNFTGLRVVEKTPPRPGE